MMGDHDIRDLEGRLARLVASIIIGIVGSLTIALLLPTRNHFPGGCMSSHGWIVEGGSPTLILAGAVGIAFAANIVLGKIAKSAPAPSPRPQPLPRAVCLAMRTRPRGARPPATSFR